MSKKVSVSTLRTQIKRILNEVEYGQTEYVVEKFGEPTAAIISMEDYLLLQEAKQQYALSNETGNAFLTKLNMIRETLQASGYQVRGKEEIDAQIRAERDSWE
ncbi:MAG: type II toxin-antitoxin system Phd/YefM family antitoxin [Anaerolineaceae bacterium]|nr:type II toxin-antitoxin system Phd/YefM family antitoxin [Anaerolineaceae bacterium]MCB9099425.1 type II toxin-antitoxin system Phd/YefM family antitoxin [Anaerolineales bacterium]